MRRLPILVTALLATFAISAGSAAAQTPTLIGTVGPGFTITLTQNGKPVKALKAGTYRIRVTDKASDHDFVLTGPGVRRSITGLAYRGTKTMKVKLRKGTYTFFCTPHKSMMQGSFKVT